MKYVKAFVHRNRVGDVVHALQEGGFRQFSLFDVRGPLAAISPREQEYSVEFGGLMISEVQLELFCEDGEVVKAVEIVGSVGATGRRASGWVFVVPVESRQSID